MTPGTAGAKRKTVSFGDQIMDNDGKQSARFGGTEERNQTTGDKDRNRNKLTEALEQVRDESAKRKSKYAKHNKGKEEEDVEATEEFGNPQSESGVYWKAQYDIYRENTQREVKKLITKQKAAKSFAKEKDEECMELVEKLQQEKEKVEKLERRTAELEKQLKELQTRTQHSHSEGQNGIIATATDGQKATNQSQDNDTKRKLDRLVPRLEALKGTRLSAATANTASTSSASQALQAPASRALMNSTDNMLPSDLKPEAGAAGGRTKRADDIWAQSFNSSSPAISKATSKSSVQTTNGRPTNSAANTNPLKALSINTMQQGQSDRNNSTQTPSPADQPSKSTEIRQYNIHSPDHDVERQISPLHSLNSPLVSPETQPLRERKSQAKNHATVTDANEDISIPVPASSPFQSLPTISSPPITATRELKPQAKGAFNGTEPPNTKENVAPTSRARPSQENVKPSAAWGAINAPAASKRTASIVDKKGREISNERLEAAKARLAARGKLVT